MGNYSELIKNFDKTRDYIRNFFIYGFMVRNDSSVKSKRTYDDEKRRVESYLGDYVHHKTTKRGKQIAIQIDSGAILENPLYKAYECKSFTDNDIKLHFLIIDLLSTDTDKKLTVHEISELLWKNYGYLCEEQTVRNKLNEYTELGIFCLQKKGKIYRYYLSEDKTKDYLKKYKGLENVLEFSSQSALFGVIPYTIMKCAGIKNKIFLAKHNYIVHTLEDDILLQLINLIENRKYAEIYIYGKRKTGFSTLTIPVKIKVSTQTGRRYLITYSAEEKKFFTVRLDNIKKVKPGRVCENYIEIKKEYEKINKNMFGVTVNEGKTEKIRVVFNIDEEKEYYVVKRLEREKRCGNVRKLRKNTFEYTAEVTNTNDMMSWLKTFIGRIVSIEGDNTELIERFKNDISQMYKMYCTEGEKQDEYFL